MFTKGTVHMSMRDNVAIDLETRISTGQDSTLGSGAVSPLADDGFIEGREPSLNATNTW